MMEVIKSILKSAMICYVVPITFLAWATFEIQYLWIGDWSALARVIYLTFVFVVSVVIHDVKHNDGKEVAKAIRDSMEKRGKLRND